MPRKTSCAACNNKDITGIFKCEGCLQTFCLKHTNEHRHLLNDELNEIILEHGDIFNAFNENIEQSSVLFDQINHWEKESILKIQQTAQSVRLQIQRLSESQKGEINIFIQLFLCVII